MKIRQINAIKESLQGNNYFIWKVEFQDGTSSNVKIRSDETSKEELEKHFGKSIDKIIYNWGQHSPDASSDRDARREYHAQQDRLERGSAKGAWATPDTFNEAGLGGINREPAPVNVSYEKVLDEVFAKYSAVLNELSQEKMKAYKGAAASNMNRPLRKMAKTADTGVPSANKKITQKRQQGPLTFEERLAEYVEEGFGDELTRQHNEKEPPKHRSTKEIPYHNWVIRYKPVAVMGDTVPWQVMDKKGDVKHRGISTTDKDAIRDAQDWIGTGGAGSNQQISSTVTIDFNAPFAKHFAEGGETFYATIDDGGKNPVLIFSTEPQKGLKTSHNKPTKNGVGSPVIALSAKEAQTAKLQANGRYVLGSKDVIDDHTIMFDLIFQSITQSSTDKMRMAQPGLTVAVSRD